MISRGGLAAVTLTACFLSSEPPEQTPPLNGCAASAFVDGGSATTVTFGGEDGSPLFGYSPACLHVAPGSSVTFSGDFSVHPIAPGASPTETDAGSPQSPIAETVSGSSLTVQFPTAGTFPYFCEMHYAAGMAGVVLVQ